MSISEDQLERVVADRVGQPSTARYARKKQAIVAAASEILNRDGITGMTLANVAARVGLITTSVTYYFKKKEDLAVACLLEAIDRLDALVCDAIKALEPRDRLKRLLESWLGLHRQIDAGEAPPIAAFNDMRTLEKAHRSVVMDRYLKFFAHVRGLFAAPELAFLDERSEMARAHMLTEQMYWAVAWLPRYDAEDHPRIRDRMFDILVHGLATPGRTWQAGSLDLDQVLASSRALTARETFLVAATRLVNERGYRGASVEKISARLNVTKGSFYHHNDAKDDLVVSCFERSFDVMRRIQRAAVVACPRDQWAELATVAATVISYQLSDRGPLLRTSALSALPGTIRQQMVEASNRISDRFAATISDGIASGSLHAVDPFIAAQMLTATLNVSSTIQRWFPGVERDEAAALYAKPMLLGIFSR
jgi:AcrR family transcriptional regulator